MENLNNVLSIENRTATWENLGTSVEGSKTLDEVIRKAGLDYTVETRPVTIQLAEDNHIILPDKVATVRTSDLHPYGVVSPKYEIIQNREAFDFMNYINGDLEYVKAGETQNGMVYIIGKLPEQYILDDKFDPYVIFRNSFNGRYPIQSAIVPLRIVCQNQFNTAFKNSDNTITIKHSRSAEMKMREAQEVLRRTAEHMNTLNDFAEKMYAEKVTKVEFADFLNKMFPMEEDATKRRNSTIETDRASFINAYNAPDNANFTGTKWGVINAFTDFQSHKPIQRKTSTAEEQRFVSVAFDPTAMAMMMEKLNSVA